MNRWKRKQEKPSLVCRLIGLLLFVLFLNPLVAAESSLKMGTARIDITPDESVMLAGYGSRKEPSIGIHDRLYVRVIAFEQDSRRLVLVSTDVLGFYGGTYDFVVKAVQSELNIPPEDLLLCSIHTHSAPTLTVDDQQGYPSNLRYTRLLTERIVGAIRSALALSEPVRMGTARGDSPVGVNRRELRPDGSIVLGRNPGGIRDTEVRTLGIFNAAGELRGVVYNYATHATSLGAQNLLISGDLVGLAAAALEQRYPNATVATLIGPSADIDPWYRVLPGFNTEQGWIPETELLGRLLAAEVAQSLERIKPDREAAPISTISSTLHLPAKVRGRLSADPNANLPAAPLRLSAARLGDVAFLGISGEVLTEVGLAIKEASPFPFTLVVTHCNGAHGYLPPAQLYPEGGYEVETSPFAPEAAGIVVKEAMRLLNELAPEASNPVD